MLRPPAPGPSPPLPRRAPSRTQAPFLLKLGSSLQGPDACEESNKIVYYFIKINLLFLEFLDYVQYLFTFS